MKKLTTFVTLVALCVSLPVAAEARHSADDPVSHVRHSANDRGVVGQPSPAKAGAGRAVERRHGADDVAGKGHRGHGRDDGPNHT